MKHTIKFRKAMLNADWARNYSVISDTSMIKIFYNLTEEGTGFRIARLKIRNRYSDLRSKVVIYSENDLEWNKFVVKFLETFDGYIENISIK